jgi:hypothetical protein
MLGVRSFGEGLVGASFKKDLQDLLEVLCVILKEFKT